MAGHSFSLSTDGIDDFPKKRSNDVSRAYLCYSKKRKLRKSHTRMLKRRLIHLLEKLIGQVDALHSNHGYKLQLSADYQKRLSVLRKVYEQEKALFAGKKASYSIVSLDRHYIRPIVRGKEIKTVEFGAKVNNIQIDVISFIEHLSFKAFNGGYTIEGVYTFTTKTNEQISKKRCSRQHLCQQCQSGILHPLRYIHRFCT